MNIQATKLLPGMILTDHVHRGRIQDVTCQGLTPEGEEMLRIDFSDAFEGILFDASQSVTISNDG